MRKTHRCLPPDKISFQMPEWMQGKVKVLLRHLPTNDCHKRQDAPTVADGVCKGLYGIQSSTEIFNQIIRMFETNRQAQQVYGATRVRTFDRRTMLNEAVGPPEAGCVGKDLYGGKNFECIRLAAFNLHGHQSAETA
jgi:hypothetical protein